MITAEQWHRQAAPDWGALSGRPAPGEKRTRPMTLPASRSGSTVCLDEAIAIQERACLLDVPQHR